MRGNQRDSGFVEMERSMTGNPRDSIFIRLSEIWMILVTLTFLVGCLNTQNRNPMKTGAKSAVTTATVITLTRIPGLDELEGDDMFEDPIPEPDEGHSEYF